LTFFWLFLKKIELPAPATPTVAAPAPMYLAAESMSLLTELVWISCLIKKNLINFDLNFLKKKLRRVCYLVSSGQGQHWLEGSLVQELD
jgi:hypothetical protein